MKDHPNYEVFEEIGRGSSATIYRAHDLSLKREVAIKELSEKLRKDPRRMQDFWEEAQFLAGIRHENIVQIHGIDQERGWIIMEMMRNSLDNLIETKGLPHDLVRSVLQQALEALKCLHARDKLHAGIRPASLLIDDQGRIKLSDSAGITVGGEFRKPTGSSKYLAPELVNPQFGAVGPGVDLYNLGFAALELLLGRQAFEKFFKGVGSGAVDPEIGWMRWHSSPAEKLPAVRDLAPTLPDDMIRVLHKLTRKDVSQRYGSAAEALADLENRDIVLVKEADRLRPKGVKPTGGPAVVAVGAAPPAPPAPPSKAVPRHAPPTPRPRPGIPAGPKPWSKDWINVQLKRPVVLLPILLLLLLPVAYVAYDLFFRGEEDTIVEPVIVTVDSNPQGAEVYVYLKDKEGKENWVKAKSPTKSSILLRPGDYKIKLELPNHETLEKTLEIKSEKAFAFDLKPLETTVVVAGRKITILSDPLGADIYIDGKKLDKVTGEEISAPAYPYRLKLVDKGKPFLERTIKSLDDEKTTFRPPPVLAQIRSEPPGAYLYLNGKKQEAKTNDKFEIPAAPLKVVLELADFKTLRVDFEKIPENFPVFKLIPGKDGFRLVHIAFLLKTPIGAKIEIIVDPKEKPREEVGPAKLSLPEGIYPIVVAKKGFRTYKGELRVVAGTKVEEIKLVALVSNYYALMVGVHDYAAEVPDFLHAESDAEGIADFLKVGDFSPERVFVLTQTRGKTAAPQNPTSANILDKLKFLADTCTEVDTVWVGFFGQVLSTKDGDFFWPAGGDKADPKTLLPLPKILKELQRCRAQTKVLLLDGWRYTFAKEMADQPYAVREYRPAKEDVHGIFFVASCQPGEKGYGELIKRHGLFGMSVVRALTGQADTNKDDRVTGAELAVHLKNVNKEAKTSYRAEQNPSVDDAGLNPAAMVVATITPPLKSFGLARAALRDKKGDVAEQHLNDALKLKPEFARAFLHRSEAAYIQGRIKDAREDLKTSLKMNPTLGLAWSNLGDVQFELEDAEAFESHARAIELEPSFSAGYRDRAYLHLQAAGMKAPLGGTKEEHLEKAIADLKKAVALNPRHPLAWHDLGRAYTLKGTRTGVNFEPAFDAFAHAIEYSLNSSDLEASYFERAQAYRACAEIHKSAKEMKEYRDEMLNAVKDYGKLVDFKSKDEDKYYYVLGRIHNQLGNVPEAAKNYEMATRVNDKYKLAFINLGVAFINLKEYTRAAKALEKAVQIDEKDGTAHRNLSRAYAALAVENPDMRAELEKKAKTHENIAKTLGAIK